MSDAPVIGTSQYDPASANDLFNFYDSRTKGENLGYSEEDLGVMKAQTTDQVTHNINESRRLGEAGELRTGGVTMGGSETINNNAINSGLAFRSSALNDIAIQNATLKQQQQFAAAGGLQSFLNNERSNQFQIWQSQYYPWQTKEMTNMYEDMFNKQQETASNAGWMQLAGQGAAAGASAYGSYLKYGAAAAAVA
jgi:hypothetical protein